MTPLRTRGRKSTAPIHALRRRLEALEDRTVPATISVANATLSEIGSPSAFVASGSGGLYSPRGIAVGPTGDLFVAGNVSAVLRYSGTTGQYISTFIPQASNGLRDVFGIAFGPDGNLYVGSGDSASGVTHAVLRYNGTTGRFMNVFVSSGSGGLTLPRGITFGPDGNLYVSSSGTNSVLRYQGPTGAAPGTPLPAAGQSGATFALTDTSPASGGPRHLLFGPDGNLYVGAGQSGIRRYDGASGALIDTFVPDSDPARGTLSSPRGMAFDQDGRLYVGDSSNAIHRYDRDGNFVGDLLPATVFGTPLIPIGLAFDTQGALLVSCQELASVVRYDRGVTVTLSAASATPVSVNYATADGTASAATDYHALSGTVTFSPGQTTRRVLLATRDDLDADAGESFAVQLSNPTSGATLGTGTAAVSITDDDGARQVTVAGTTAAEGDARAHYRGDFVDGFSGGHFNPLTFGPDGLIYTAVGTGVGYNSIRRYDAATGAFVDTFVPAGRINGVRDMVFRGGFMYVASAYTNEVLRFDATTGAFVDAFVSVRSGGIEHPDGMAFGPDANNDGVPELYVTGWLSHSVVRYDGVTGQPLGTFIAPGSGGLSYPFSLAFGPGGAFVTSAATNQILKYDAQTGAYLGVAASAGLAYPRGLTFGPDGLLYVTSGDNDRILRFTAAGAYVDVFVPAGAAGMDNPRTPRFGPDGDLYVTSTGNSGILRFGTANEAVLTVSLSTPSTLPVTVNVATADGTALAGNDYTALAGTVTFAPGQTARTILVPISNDATAENSEAFTLSLSSPAGAVVAGGSGVVSLSDDDATKFFVVNDAATDQTYRYGAPGNGQSVTALAGGNVAPRGAASTVAGDKLWVVDANKTVYVYSSAGALLGSWAAGGMNATAQVEGIATNGTDVWLLDAKQDKVFKYTGAASRLTGSQNAASSFNLNNANGNAKGLVTDGTSFWVVDDAATDKVFKYTLAGTLLGSWTIDAANASPTGLTIDPANVSDIWIVDNGTDKVYQYAAAAGRTSGSQVASATFALAAGNTNPQDIADPPAISIGDATATEGGTAYRFTDKFVAPDGYGLAAPRGLTVGPDGRLYVASHDTDVVKVFEGGTGRFLRDLATPGGELDGPWSMIFGIDGRLYVSGRYSHNIVRFDIASGTSDVFVATGTGGLSVPWGIAFGADGNLYASSVVEGSPGNTRPVKHFNGVTGAYLGDFVPAGSGGLNGAAGIAFGPDGHLYVASSGSREIKRYNGQTGAFIDNFISTAPGGQNGNPGHLLFHSDGYLYVTYQNLSSLYQYSSTTGALVAAIPSPELPEPAGGFGLAPVASGPSGEIYVAMVRGLFQPGQHVARFAPASLAAFTINLDTPSASPVTVSFSTANSSAIAGSDYAATSGTIDFAPGQTTRTILVRTLDDALSEPAETFAVTLSNPVGATLADGQAVGTIADNEPTLPRVARVDANGLGVIQRSRVMSVVVTFDATVTIAGPVAEAFTLSRIGGGAVGSFTATASVVNGATRVTLSGFAGAETQFGSLADGRYRLSVRADRVSLGGQPLDGNGDGIGGDDYTLDGTAANGLYRLYGDATGDGFVNAADFAQFRGAFGSAAGQAAYVEWLDLDGDGFINAFDFAQFRTRFGSTVP